LFFLSAQRSLLPTATRLVHDVHEKRKLSNNVEQESFVKKLKTVYL